MERTQKASGDAEKRNKIFIYIFLHVNTFCLLLKHTNLYTQFGTKNGRENNKLWKTNPEKKLIKRCIDWMKFFFFFVIAIKSSYNINFISDSSKSEREEFMQTFSMPKWNA